MTGVCSSCGARAVTIHKNNLCILCYRSIRSELSATIARVKHITEELMIRRVLNEERRLRNRDRRRALAKQLEEERRR